MIDKNQVQSRSMLMNGTAFVIKKDASRNEWLHLF